MTSFIHLDYRKLKMLLKQEVTSKMLETMGDGTFETAILFLYFHTQFVPFHVTSSPQCWMSYNKRFLISLFYLCQQI